MAKSKDKSGAVSEEVAAAFKRIVAHAESHGEVYDGAINDIAVVKEALGLDGDDSDDDANDGGTVGSDN